jgi:hypothetical protein
MAGNIFSNAWKTCPGPERTTSKDAAKKIAE